MKFRFIQKMTSTLRGRLSLWYLTSVGLIITLFSIASSVLFWVTLQEQIDHHVHIAVNEAKQVIENYQGEERDNLIKSLVSAKGMTVVVLSPDGSAILETNSPDVAIVTEHQLQKILILSGLHESNPTHFTENNIRFAATTALVSAGKGIVAVGYSTRVLYDAFFRMLIIVFGVLFFLVLPITYFGHQLLKNQLQPLENIAMQAKTVTDPSSLNKLISINSPTLELATIQQAINSMLIRLGDIFTNEREFFSDAAHTLQTPLAILRSQVESGNFNKKTQQKMITTIDNASETVQDLLLLSQIAGKAQKLEVFSLTQIMNSLVELATTIGDNKKITISSNIQKKISLRADKKMLTRALVNIVHNAVNYSEPHGNITFALEKLTDQITITIKDTGVGVSQKDLPLIFSRFFRGTRPIGKGSGLGLAISKAVVENLGGHIAISSALNKGTTVKITLT